MKNINTKRIVLFLIITFVASYALLFAVIVPYSYLSNQQSSVTYNVISAIITLIPALAVLLTRIITKEGFADHNLLWTLKRNTTFYYLFAWFSPTILTILGLCLYFLRYNTRFDWNMTYYFGKVVQSGTEVEIDALRSTLLSQLITSVIIGPIMNFITCFGEEWGWRGYLLPKLLKKMPYWGAIILSGFISGLWNIPYIIAGLNYGKEYTGYPYVGILLMILFCISTGVLYSYVTIKSGSCLPAILSHGAMNAIAATGIYFTNDGGDLLLGPATTGLISMVPTIITAVILLVLLKRDKSCRTDSSCDTIA